jgi:hypothetical protein
MSQTMTSEIHMLKRLLHLGWLLALALAACRPSATPAPPSSPVVPPPGLTFTPASGAPAPTRDTANLGCTVVTRRNQPTAASPFPPVTTADWSLGPANAAVTLIEYSDFQ